MDSDEDDLSAEKEAEIKGSWFSQENEHCRRKKGIGCKTSKRQKKIISLGHNIVVFSSFMVFYDKS